jgi:hypothetical protein
MNRLHKQLFSYKYKFHSKAIILIFAFVLSYLVPQAQSITEIVTDYNGYWKSGVGAIDPTVTKNSHNLLSFKYNSVHYSTGVNDATLAAHNITHASGVFKALPFSSIGGNVSSGSATYIALGTLYDGVDNGASTPLPSLRIRDVLNDGLNGLNIGTGVTNVPNTATITFPVTVINVNEISDSKPDILFTQTAQPAGAGDVMYFEDAAGVRVGNQLAVTWTSISSVGNHIIDQYSMNNVSCDLAVVNGLNSTNQPKEMRLVAYRLSEFGVTTSNAGSVTKLIIKPGGSSDPAFIAYNTEAFSIPVPVITSQPLSQTVCPGTNSPVTFSVVAFGSNLTYQWYKNTVAIAGATSSSYTITNVSAADAGTYEVQVSNASGTATSSIAYLNTVIAAQPLPVTQTIPTGNSVTLSISATNATGYQWQKDGVDISGATSSSYIVNNLTSAGTYVYRVKVLNGNDGGCISLTSNNATVIATTTLYSKSTGNINDVSSWGVNSTGSGTNPATFLRSEHTFNISNRTVASTQASLTIAGTLNVGNAVLTITPGTLLTAGRITRSGTGSIAGSATSSLSLAGVSDLNFQTGNQVLKNLNLSGGTVNLNTPLNITAGLGAGIVTVSGGILNTLDNLTLKSDANGTATVGSSAGTIVGKVTVERFMPSRRAWRLMTAPIASSGAPTINAAWMEGATSSVDDVNPGYGTHITGGSVANGFDQSPTNSPSIKYLANNTWSNLANTNVTTVKQYPGFFFFVRGNRSYTISSTVPSYTALTTVLRVKGNLNQGTQDGVPVGATGLTLVSNPYASPVSFSSLLSSSTNIKNRVYLWDPNLGGLTGVGGYTVLDWNGSSYFTVPSSAMNSIIQPGQAFFVQSNNGTSGGSFVFKEADKVSTTATTPFGRPLRTDASLMIDFKVINTDGSASMIDGTMARYNEDYADGIDNDDVIKSKNFNENISILSNGKLVTIERRSVPGNADTLSLNITGLKTAKYQLDILPGNFENLGLNASLYDRYTQKVYPVSNADTAHYTFNVTSSNSSSHQANRFSIVFSSAATLPVTITSVKATATRASTIDIEWEVLNEQNISHYEVEKLSNNSSFTAIGNVKATVGGTLKAGYSFTDNTISEGDNIYRIKSLGLDGRIQYSNVVKVTVRQSTQRLITAYPNPIRNSTFNVSLTNVKKGKYSADLYNGTGQKVYSQSFHHTGVNSIQTIMVPGNLAKGIYRLQVMSEGGVIQIINLGKE